MPLTERNETVTAHDGGSFDAHTVTPDAGSGPGVLLLQEIFGVNDYVRSVAQRIAELGFVVLAPDLYWRLERNVSLDDHTEEGLARALEYGQRFDFDNGIRDCGASFDHLRSLPEVSGRCGVVGFCFGGTLAYHVAARFAPDFAVSYYGSGVPDALELAEQITCPILFHFGGDDPYIARPRVEEARAALEPRPEVEFYVHENAAHAFDNRSPMFHNADAAAAAWEKTVAFLRRNR